MLTPFFSRLLAVASRSTGPRDLFLGLTQTSSAELCGAVRSKSSAGLGRVAAWHGPSVSWLIMVIHGYSVFDASGPQGLFLIFFGNVLYQ